MLNQLDTVIKNDKAGGRFILGCKLNATPMQSFSCLVEKNICLVLAFEITYSLPL